MASTYNYQMLGGEEQVLVVLGLLVDLLKLGFTKEEATDYLKKNYDIFYRYVPEHYKLD